MGMRARSGFRWPIGPLALGLGLAIAACAAPQVEAGGDAGGGPARGVAIPFALTPDGNISVAAELNGTDVLELMLHTAVDSVSLTRATFERAQSLRVDGEAEISSWGGSERMRHSSDNSLRIGAQVFDGLGVSEDIHSGRGTDGKFGCNLFGESILVIDFEAQELVLHDELPDLSGYERFELEVSRGGMFIEGTIRAGSNTYDHRFLVHSGYSGGVLLDDAFVAAHGLDQELESLGSRELRDSLGNVLVTHRVALPALRLGSVELVGVGAELFSGAIGRQKLSVLGIEVLRRFRVVIDAARGRLYLRPIGN